MNLNTIFKKYAKPFVLFCLATAPFLGQTQIYLTEKEEQSLIVPQAEHNQTVPEQSIYLQTDKDIYETQEDIWFNAIIKSATTLRKDTNSSIFYLSIIDENNESIINAKYPIIDGQVDGYLFLKEVLEPGFYNLVGYTNHSIRYRSQFYHTTKQIEIREHIIPKILHRQKNVSVINNQTQIDLEVTPRTGLSTNNIKVRLIGAKGKKSTILAKANTNQKGHVQLLVNHDEAIRFPNYFLETIAKQKEKQVDPFQLNLGLKPKKTIKFYTQNSSLIDGISQKISFQCYDRNGIPSKLDALLLENHKVIDTLKTKLNGLGDFQLKPSSNSEYQLIPFDDELLEYQFPLIEKHGAVFTLEGMTKQVLKLKFKTNELNKFSGPIFIRLQSRGFINYIGKGELTRSNQSIQVPINKLPPGIAEISIVDKEMNSLFNRLVYVHAGQQLNITQQNSLENQYSTKSKVQLQLKVTDKLNRPLNAKFNIRVYDHIYNVDHIDRNIASFYHLESVLNEPIYNAGTYFLPEANDDLIIQLMNTIPTKNYIWSITKQATNHGKFHIQETVVGKLMKRTENGTLIPVAFGEVQLFSSKAITALNTDETGMFKIPKELLISSRGERIFVKSLQPNTIIELLKNDNTIFNDEEVRNQFPIHLQYASKNESTEMLEDQLRYFGINSINFLDEVVVKAKHKNRVKDEQDVIEYVGTGGNYVCWEFNVLNCVNHRSGRPPEYGKVYKDNYGRRIVFQAPKGDQPVINTPKDFVIIQSFYPKKNFKQPQYINEENELELDNRKTLFWKNGIQADQNGNIDLSFYTSDNRGKYKGIVDVYTDDGQFGVYEFSINVY